MALTREEVAHIAALVRLRLTPEEADAFGEQLSNILEHFEQLRQLDTSGVVPTAHAAELETVLREDQPGECLSPEETLSNAPRREGDFFRVKAVLEE